MNLITWLTFNYEVFLSVITIPLSFFQGIEQTSAPSFILPLAFSGFSWSPVSFWASISNFSNSCSSYVVSSWKVNLFKEITYLDVIRKSGLLHCKNFYSVPLKSFWHPSASENTSLLFKLLCLRVDFICQLGV